jgi:hypothetical protein
MPKILILPISNSETRIIRIGAEQFSPSYRIVVNAQCTEMPREYEIKGSKHVNTHLANILERYELVMVTM